MLIGLVVLLQEDQSLDIVFFLAIHLSHGKQRTTEAEYRSMAAITCEFTWLRYLLQDL